MIHTKKSRIAILKNEDPYDHLLWVSACEKRDTEIEFIIIDLTSENWLKQIQDFTPDYLLLKPAGKTTLFRDLYTERVDILIHDLGYNSFPTYDEVRIYESKRFFANWAMANKIDHPRTWIFYNKAEVNNWIETAKYPIVGKLNIGASGNGIKILKSKPEIEAYIAKAFSEGLSARTGPKLGKGNIVKRFWSKLLNPQSLINRLKTYSEIAADKQKGYVIFQEYIAHDFEWRAVRIGDSFFAHKKLKKGDKASGSLLKNYDNPPEKLFDYVKGLTDRFNFRSVAIDIFEDSKGDYLVNEIQCIFGQSDPYQMLVNNTPGRYLKIDNKWIFEAGDFNSNESFDLRLSTVIENINKTSK